MANGKGVLKMTLIDSLDEEEKVAFVFLLSRFWRSIRAKESVLGYLQDCDTQTLFGLLHREVFGDWNHTYPAMNKVLNNLDKVKEVLRVVSVDRSFIEKRVFAGDICPKRPRDLLVKNNNIGNVSVTIHAWKQFWNRFCRIPSESELARELMCSFARAVPVEIRKGYSVLRTIRNEKPAFYFFDRKIGCRFVVISENNRRILLTAERPRP